MRILIDTNIFVYREDYKEVESSLSQLFKVFNQLRVEILIHPRSIDDLKRDSNEQRKSIILSKIEAYTLLESPPNPSVDKQFIDFLGIPDKINDKIDNTILFAAYKDAVDFLITNDKGIHQKAKRIDIKDRVLSVNEALDIFSDLISKSYQSHLPALKDEFVYNLDINDPFFNSLKVEYGHNEFIKWFKKISREGRKCLVHFKENKRIGALLIHKIEDEAIDSTPILFTKRRLKLSTFKVSYTGYKLGELFIKLAVQYSIRNKINEMYLTHYEAGEKTDFLVDLITEFGFKKTAKLNNTGESVYLKKMIYDENEHEINPLSISKTYYPSFYEGEDVNKFIVPIIPKWHKKLFTEYKEIKNTKNKKGRQPTLDEFAGQFIVEGNTIEKAYLSNAKSKKISSGDILLFYRSQDETSITSLGVVEKVFHGIQNTDEIIRLVAKRSVYSYEDIVKIAKKPTMVILFTWHFHLSNPLMFSELKEIGILKGRPQSVTQITHEDYLQIKKRGHINECFVVDKT